MMPSPIRLLTVDAAGTLVRPWPSVGAVYGSTARKFGLQVEDSEVDRRFYDIFGKAQINRQITQGEEKEFWRHVVCEVFLPYAKDIDLDPLFEELWDLFAHGEHWRLAEGAKETLSELKKRGYELAVLSNNDSRLRSVLDDLEVSPLFDEIFISSELGCEKPDPEIFRSVERTMRKTPDQILHLGDSHSRDFEGARAAGWSALLFGSPRLEEQQIESFSELLGHLP